ncbi:MAG: hypothetical protein U0795_24245 [Pirellulales bacterium]
MRIRDVLLDFALIAVATSVATMLPFETKTNTDTPEVRLALFSAWFALGLLALYCLTARWESRLFGIGSKQIAPYVLLFLLAMIAFAILAPIARTRAAPVLGLLVTLGYLFLTRSSCRSAGRSEKSLVTRIRA